MHIHQEEEVVAAFSSMGFVCSSEGIKYVTISIGDGDYE